MKRNLYVMENDGSVRRAVSRDEFLALMGEDLKKSLHKENVYGICDVCTSFVGTEPLDKKPKSIHGHKFLFETLVVGGPIDGFIVRYPTFESATKGHADMVKKVKSCIN